MRFKPNHLVLAFLAVLVVALVAIPTFQLVTAFSTGPSSPITEPDSSVTPKKPTPTPDSNLVERVTALEGQIVALIALHPTPTPTPPPIPPRNLFFDQPIVISGASGVYGLPASAVVDGQGTVHVIWGSTPTPSSIMYASKPAGGSWTPPVNISNQPLHSHSPKLALSSDGTLHVVWEQAEEVDGRGFASLFYSSKLPGGVWSSPVDIDQSQVDVNGKFLIAIDGTQRVHVVWQDNYTSNAGTGWSIPVKISVNSGITRELIADPNGALHLLSKKSGVLYHTVRDVAENWGNAEVIATDASQGLGPSLSSLHLDNTGTLHAGWIADLPGLDNPVVKLFHSTKGPSGSWTVPIVVNTKGSADHADMMVFSDGEAIGTWTNSSVVEVSALHPDGTWLPAVTVAQGSWPVVIPEDPDTIHLFFNSGAQLFYTKSQ